MQIFKLKPVATILAWLLCTIAMAGPGMVCGNGSPDPGEQCDDGNLNTGDGCSSSCLVEQPDFVCTDATEFSPIGQDIVDGSLEQGRAEAVWRTDRFETNPICSQLLCGEDLGTDGAFFGWFRDFGQFDIPYLEQDVRISVTASELTFDFSAPVCNDPTDRFAIFIGTVELFRYTCTAVTDGYQSVSVPLGMFADGGLRQLRFEATSDVYPNAGSEFLIDRISIENTDGIGAVASVCTPLAASCVMPESFASGIPSDWTVINRGPDPGDGWGTSDDGLCATQNWSQDGEFDNVARGGGAAACADSDATGQIDVDAGMPPNEMDTYLCTPPLNTLTMTDPRLTFLLNYQAAENALNDNGTPDDPADDVDTDFFRVLGGTTPPTATSVLDYQVLSRAEDHTDTTLALSRATSVDVDMCRFNGDAASYVCFHYRGTQAWFAQIDNVSVRAASCTSPPDSDGDGVHDGIDNCTFIPNANQIDSNSDGYGNICDIDLNGDLIAASVDLGLFRTLFFTDDADADFNSDGVVNVLDLAIFRRHFFLPPGPSGFASCSGNF